MDDRPTLYERALAQAGARAGTLSRVTILKSRRSPHLWWALNPMNGQVARARSRQRVLKLAEDAWGDGHGLMTVTL